MKEIKKQQKIKYPERKSKKEQMKDVKKVKRERVKKKEGMRER